MPLKIKKVAGGYKVSDGKKDFSKRALTKAMAEKQRLAIAIPISKKQGKPLESYFA